MSLSADDGIPIAGFRANLRNTDDFLLGTVTDKYKVVQNHEAFAFTDALLGQGVRYETAGMLQDGRKIWILEKLPQRYQMISDWIDPYLVYETYRTDSYQKNLFAKTLDGNSLIDKAHHMILKTA